MNVQILAEQYATAVFSLWSEPLQKVQEELSENPAIVQSLRDNTRPFHERQMLLRGLIPDKGNTEAVRNLLYTMLKNDQLNLLGDVLTHLQSLATGKDPAEMINASVTTAIELSADDKEAFHQKLTAKYGDNLDIAFKVDAAIMGGAVVQVGDKIVDGSVATRLQAMSNALGVAI